MDDTSVTGYKFSFVSCNLCDSNDLIYLGKRYGYVGEKARTLIKVETSVFKCRKCDLIFPNPFPIATDDRLQKNYSNAKEYFDENLQKYKKEVYSSLLNRLNKIFKERGRLLDVGCGRGDFLEMAKAYGWDCIGVDISEEFIEQVRLRGIEARTGLFNKIGFPENYFDVIVMYASLEHTFNPKEYLIETKRVLKNRGVLYLKVPNEGSILFAIGDIYNKLIFRKNTTHLSVFSTPFHLYGFSRKTIEKVFCRIGLDILELRIFNDGPSGFRRNAKIMDRLIGIGYVFIHYLCKFINQGISLEVYALK